MRSIPKLAVAALLLAPILPFEANASCSPRTQITGTWKSDDQGTYIVRRVDNTMIWWMGQSADGRVVNMFRGMFDGKKTIRGSWVDIKGWQKAQDGQGTLVLELDGTDKSLSGFRKVGGTGTPFNGTRWFFTCDDN
jgi:hypothetical protein